jgi:hypothetical protein
VRAILARTLFAPTNTHKHGKFRMAQDILSQLVSRHGRWRIALVVLFALAGKRQEDQSMKRGDRAKQDRAPSDDGNITRRDFLNGCPVAAGGAIAAGLLPELAASAFAATAAQDAPGYYPPALTGLRGNHVGSFEIAHQLRDGDFWSRARPVDNLAEVYDLGSVLN